MMKQFKETCEELKRVREKMERKMRDSKAKWQISWDFTQNRAAQARRENEEQQIKSMYLKVMMGQQRRYKRGNLEIIVCKVLHKKIKNNDIQLKTVCHCIWRHWKEPDDKYHGEGRNIKSKRNN